MTPARPHPASSAALPPELQRLVEALARVVEESQHRAAGGAAPAKR
jgi:hypothetical protein